MRHRRAADNIPWLCQRHKGGRGRDSMAIVSTANLKGGVGKTSCTMHIGGELARAGRRVLLVDNDPQASLTAGIFGPEEPARIDPAYTLAAVHAGDEPLPEAVIRATPFAGLDLAP